MRWYRADIEKADIDVVETKQLRGVEDLTGLLFQGAAPPNFSGELHCCTFNSGDGWDRARQAHYDAAMSEMLQTILYCRPSLRRKLKHLLDYLDSLDSLAPLAGDNPKREVLGQVGEGELNSLERQHTSNGEGNHIRPSRFGGYRAPTLELDEDLHGGRDFAS